MLNSICASAFGTITLDMTNKEVFTYTKTMQQPDAPQFIEATDKEINDHQSWGHWDIVKQSAIPPGLKQYRLPRVSSGRDIPMELLRSTRLGCALTAACSNGASHIGRLTPRS